MARKKTQSIVCEWVAMGQAPTSEGKPENPVSRLLRTSCFFCYGFNYISFFSRIQGGKPIFRIFGSFPHPAYKLPNISADTIWSSARLSVVA